LIIAVASLLVADYRIKSSRGRPTDAYRDWWYWIDVRE
jgi:hypothetical protein